MRWTRSSPSLHPTVRPPEQSAGPDWAAFYDQAACGLLVTAHDGTIHLVNQTFCTWLGVERESLVGKLMEARGGS